MFFGGCFFDFTEKGLPKQSLDSVFVFVFAHRHGASVTGGRFCGAHVSSELNDSVTEGGLLLHRDDLFHYPLDLGGIAEGIVVKAKSAADPHKMGIADYAAHTENVAADQVCDLSANAGH